MPERLLDDAADRLKRWSFIPTGSEGFAKAEVTAGGIDTAALSSKTMEAREVPGLYVIGEAVDVTGWLGGYNFQWAWASGRSEEHTSELQSLMRISYAVFCLKKKNNRTRRE